MSSEPGFSVSGNYQAPQEQQSRKTTKTQICVLNNSCFLDEPQKPVRKSVAMTCDGLNQSVVPMRRFASRSHDWCPSTLQMVIISLQVATPYNAISYADDFHDSEKRHASGSGGRVGGVTQHIFAVLQAKTSPPKKLPDRLQHPDIIEPPYPSGAAIMLKSGALSSSATLRFPASAGWVETSTPRQGHGTPRPAPYNKGRAVKISLCGGDGWHLLGYNQLSQWVLYYQSWKRAKSTCSTKHCWHRSTMVKEQRPHPCCEPSFRAIAIFPMTEAE